MADNKKFVTCGPNAYSFHDPSTGITIVKGQKIELNNHQLHSPRVRLALSSNHLVYVVGDVDPSNDDSNVIEKAIKKAKKMAKEGVTIDKMVSKFDHNTIVKMAESEGVKIEDGDTDASILEAIVSD